MNAQTKYTELMNKLENDLILLNEKLKKHQTSFNQEPSNWGYVGELGFVSEKIDEVLNFIKK